MDNSTDDPDKVLKIEKRYFKIKKLEFYDGFIDKLIGGLRGKNRFMIAKLLKEFESQDKKFKDESNALKKQETELLTQKKSLSSEDYKKKVSVLRKKNMDFQNKRRGASNNFIKKKNNARADLLKALNPILKKYMDENNIMMIFNEKNVILANSKVDLTNVIIELLNKELKSIKLN